MISEHKLRILWIGNNIIAKVYKPTLEEYGFKVFSMRNQRSGLIEFAKFIQCDAIALCLGNNIHETISAIKQLKAITNSPLILLYTNVYAPMIEQLVETDVLEGCNTVLMPVAPELLADAINDAVSEFQT